MSIQPEELVRRYYMLVDVGRTEDLLALFADDVVYERQGTPTIRGKAELRRFYSADRMIVSGRHDLEEVLPGKDWVAVRGTFCGTLKNGEWVELQFTDWHHVVGDKIDHRQSLFPGRAV